MIEMSGAAVVSWAISNVVSFRKQHRYVVPFPLVRDLLGKGSHQKQARKPRATLV